MVSFFSDLSDCFHSRDGPAEAGRSTVRLVRLKPDPTDPTDGPAEAGRSTVRLVRLKPDPTDPCRRSGTFDSMEFELFSELRVVTVLANQVPETTA
jgi:hypothetical protein